MLLEALVTNRFTIPAERVEVLINVGIPRDREGPVDYRMAYCYQSTYITSCLSPMGVGTDNDNNDSVINYILRILKLQRLILHSVYCEVILKVLFLSGYLSLYEVVTI